MSWFTDPSTHATMSTLVHAHLYLYVRPKKLERPWPLRPLWLLRPCKSRYAQPTHQLRLETDDNSFVQGLTNVLGEVCTIFLCKT